jgi:hypothetical protein
VCPVEEKEFLGPDLQLKGKDPFLLEIGKTRFHLKKEKVRSIVVFRQRKKNSTKKRGHLLLPQKMILNIKKGK